MRSSRTGLRRQVECLLTDLGEAPGEIADSLNRAGARGEPQHHSRCVLASYLSAVVGSDPGIASIEVGVRRVRITRSDGWRRRVTIAAPAQIVEFIRGFDLGLYPQLLDRPRPELRWAQQTESI
jgi:hypothetical protein